MNLSVQQSRVSLRSGGSRQEVHPCALVRRVGVMIRLLGANTGDEAIAGRARTAPIAPLRGSQPSQ
jgi:hypothetical protein